jgi:hypothetical protein
MPANIEYFHYAYRFARAPRSRRVGRVRRAWRGRDARAGERRHRRARAWIQALEALDETRVRVCARYTSIQKYFYPSPQCLRAKRRRLKKKKLSSNLSSTRVP